MRLRKPRCLSCQARRASIIASFGLLCITMPLSAVDALTGNDWRMLPERVRQGYVTGVLDVWTTVVDVSKEVQKGNPRYIPSTEVRMFSPATTCYRENMTYGQVFAVVDRYMSQHPENWDYAMATLVWDTMHQTCNPPDKR
jgi:hypothetical protein